MLSLEEIKKSYPENLHSFQRFILREYLQHKILEIIFESKYSNKLCFIGGTCLRIVHNNNRFSEDLDFDNFNLQEEDFEAIAALVEKGLKREGYEVELKNTYAKAFYCYIRFPGLLFETGLSGYKEEKILIQLDTVPQHFDFKPEAHLINRFDVFTNIQTTPLSILLAQKFYAICNRKRHKGRDFFDVVFLLARTKPDYDYLKLKIDVNTPDKLKGKVLSVCQQINFEEMAKDVQPFLFDSRDVKKILLFEDYIKQVEL